MIQEIFLTVISSCNAFSSKIDTSFNGGLSRSANDFQSVLITTPSGKNYYVKQYVGLDDNPSIYEIITPHGYFASAEEVDEEGSGPTYTFNCHSFAWLYDGELSNVPSVRYCVDDPHPFISSAPYCYSSYDEYQYPSQITNASSISVGDIIVYYDVDQSSNSSTISHSAVVTSSSSNIYGVNVRSKWRFGATYNHSIFACPYYTPPGPNNDESKIRVYKISHSSKHYEYVSPMKHSVVSNCCGRSFGLQSHTFVYVNGTYQCNKCYFQTGILPYSGGDIDE